MQRVFKCYRPQQVARFVKTLFRGTFVIVGIGVFTFDGGKVLLPDLTNKPMLVIMKEVNAQIDALSVLSV